MMGLWITTKPAEKPNVSAQREFRDQFLFFSILIGKELDFEKIDGSAKAVPKAHTVGQWQSYEQISWCSTPTPDIGDPPSRSPTFTIFNVSIQIFECMEYNEELCFYIHLLMLTSLSIQSQFWHSVLNEPLSVFAGNLNVFPTRICLGFPVTSDLIDSGVLMWFLGQGHRIIQHGSYWE